MPKPHVPDFLILAGLIADGWLARLSVNARALLTLCALLSGVFALGVTANRCWEEQRGAPARLDRVERLAVRDSARIDQVEATADSLLPRVVAVERATNEVRESQGRIEADLERVICFLQWSPGKPLCI